MTAEGWGVVAALVVGGLAYLGVVQGIKASRVDSSEADARERWWAALMWLWDNRDEMSRASMIEALDALRESAQTETQTVMLRSVASNALRSTGPAKERRAP